MEKTEPKDAEYGYKPLPNIDNDCKEYLITEWTCDHGHTNWWTYQEIMNESGISRGNTDPNEWHCMFHEVRIQSAKNVLTKKDIADKFGIKVEDLIIIG